jgi:hypothetical protein
MGKPVVGFVSGNEAPMSQGIVSITSGAGYVHTPAFTGRVPLARLALLNEIWGIAPQLSLQK